MENQLLIALITFNLLGTFILLALRNKKSSELANRIDALDRSLTKIETGLREDFRIHREDAKG